MGSKVRQSANRRRALASIVVAAALSLSLSACGSSGGKGAGGTTNVTFSLDFFPDGLHAPLYLAKADNLIHGVNLSIEPGQGSAASIKIVAAGRAQMGFADASAVSAGVAGGAKVTAVALLLQHTPAVTVVQKTSKAMTVKDLGGSSIGDNPQGSTALLLPAVLKANGVDPKSVHPVSMAYQARVPSLKGGKVDAIDGYAQEFSPFLNEFRLIPWYKNGLDSYGTVMIVNNDFLKSNPDAVRAVVAGMLDGLTKTLADPATAAKDTAADNRGEASFFQGELGVLKSYFVDPASPTMDSARWDAVQKLMITYGGQPKTVPADQLYTNDYLPK